MSKNFVEFKPISSGPPEPLPVEDVIRFIGYGTPLRFYTPRNELIARFVGLTEHDGKFKMLLLNDHVGFFTIDSEIMMGNDFGDMPNKNSSPILKDTHADGAMVVFNEKQYLKYLSARRDYWINPHPHGGRKMRSHRRKSSRKMRQHRRKSLRTRGRSH
jgi:hypothetical protein